MIYSLEVVFMALIIFIIALIFSLFSPLGIFFAIFSIIRGKTQNRNLRMISFILQILLMTLTLIIGILVSLAILLSSYRIDSEQAIVSIAVIIGVLFTVAIETGVVIWETLWIKEKEVSLAAISRSRR